MTKSPLRFPGGKSRAIGQILPLIPDFDEYREPMVGGGSVLLALRQRSPQRRYWMNDLNYELYCFWKVAQECADRLADTLHRLHSETQDGRTLFYRLLERYGQGDEFERAVRFFVLNRITFSGTVDSGGYSEQAFRGRFTPSAIERIRQVAPLLQGVRITHGDYEPVLREAGDEVFIFLDPPYYSATNSRLYGKRGELHLNFDHHRLARVLNQVAHRWLLTYDDSPFIRELYADYAQVRWTLQYGMNNYKQPCARAGRELFIANYPIQARDSSPQLALVFERNWSRFYSTAGAGEALEE
ncbi:MAG: DNA methyltransferase [Fimbriimonadales bacterium]|nr:MAG: DNA methyltransferase [Fimbriimonadales bacterium]